MHGWDMGEIDVQVVKAGLNLVVEQKNHVDLHQLLIPIPHLAARVPKRPVHAHKVAPSLFSQGGLELFPSHRVAPLDVELGSQLFVQLMVPPDVVAEMEDCRLGTGGRGDCRRGRLRSRCRRRGRWGGKPCVAWGRRGSGHDAFPPVSTTLRESSTKYTQPSFSGS